MNEQAARNVVLMSAIEQADQERRILTDEDRKYASRSANELAQWDMAGQSGAMPAALFLEKRAEQVLRKVAERHPGFAKVIARRNGWRIVGIVLPFLSFLSGFLADRIADPHRVDLLSPPLLLILAWNLLAYLALLLWPLVPALRRRRPGGGLVARLAIGRLTAPRRLPQGLGAAVARFGEEWGRLSLPLTVARSKRIIHLAAACFALGAILSLYLRGVLTQYRAGWESTFLNAEQVHALLGALFMPVISLFGLEGFSLAEVRALEFGHAASAGSMDGAKWVHLYAATLLLFVVLPRLLLSAAARWKEKRLAKHFPIDLNQPYFRRLAGGIGSSAPVVLRVFPYSFTVDEARDRNLSSVAQMLLGEQARVMLRPSTAYGESPQQALQDTAPASADIALTVALFNLSATPEKENHGAFLDHLARGNAHKLLALIDESAYLERIGAKSGETRVRERIALWQQFCDLHNVRGVIVNLLDPQARADDIERSLHSLARST